MNKFFKIFIDRARADGFFFIFVAASFALTMALFLEYALNLRPCSLCKWQSLLYIILQCLSVIGIYFSKSKCLVRPLAWFALILEWGVSVYHIGIEHYIFSESFICMVSEVSCADVQFRFMNLSPAEWNLIYISAMLYYLIINRKNNGFITWRP